MMVLGIDVDDELLDCWRSWLMPSLQPFVVSTALATRSGWPVNRGWLTPELRDSFELYDVSHLREKAVAWLSKDQARSLPDRIRRAQPSAHRWPTDDWARDVGRAVRYVESGRRPSRHAEISSGDWKRIADLLPGVEVLAGRFPRKSGPNCFGTVMAAAGVNDAADEWVQIEPFEAWLAGAASQGGRDDQPATVLLWRDRSGRPVHAAVTLGGGWLLHKPSQGWMSPIKVLSVSDGKLSARTPGWRLTRYRLQQRHAPPARATAQR